MSRRTAQNTEQPKAPTAFEKLTNLDEYARKHITDLETRIAGMEEEVAAMSAALTAVMDIACGKTPEESLAAIQARIQARTNSQLQQLAANWALNVQRAVDEGRIAPAETVGPNSILSATQKSSTGDVREPGICFSQVWKLPEDLQQKVIGQKAGAVIGLEDGDVFEIHGCWSPVGKQAVGEADTTVPAATTLAPPDSTPPAEPVTEPAAQEGGAEAK
jgi:hypothetical protein